LGFTAALWVLAACREILGAGTITLYEIPLGAEMLQAYLVAPGAFGEDFQPVLLMILPPGAFIVLGLLVAVMNYIDRKDWGVVFGIARVPVPEEPQPAAATPGGGAARMVETPSGSS